MGEGEMRVRMVIRRVGGLEEMPLTPPPMATVIRRVGGLEVRYILTREVPLSYPPCRRLRSCRLAP